MSNKTNIAIEKIQEALAPHERTTKEGEIVVTEPAFVGPFKRGYIEQVLEMAKAMGFYAKDLFILVRNNVLWSPNMENQQHARKNHSFYWVFKKGKAK